MVRVVWRRRLREELSAYLMGRIEFAVEEQKFRLGELQGEVSVI